MLESLLAARPVFDARPRRLWDSPQSMSQTQHWGVACSV